MMNWLKPRRASPNASRSDISLPLKSKTFADEAAYPEKSKRMSATETSSTSSVSGIPPSHIPPVQHTKGANTAKGTKDALVSRSKADGAQSQAAFSQSANAMLSEYASSIPECTTMVHRNVLISSEHFFRLALESYDQLRAVHYRASLEFSLAEWLHIHALLLYGRVQMVQTGLENLQSVKQHNKIDLGGNSLVFSPLAMALNAIGLVEDKDDGVLYIPDAVFPTKPSSHTAYSAMEMQQILNGTLYDWQRSWGRVLEARYQRNCRDTNLTMTRSASELMCAIRETADSIDRISQNQSTIHEEGEYETEYLVQLATKERNLSQLFEEARNTKDYTIRPPCERVYSFGDHHLKAGNATTSSEDFSIKTFDNSTSTFEPAMEHYNKHFPAKPHQTSSKYQSFASPPKKEHAWRLPSSPTGHSTTEPIVEVEEFVRPTAPLLLGKSQFDTYHDEPSSASTYPVSPLTPIDTEFDTRFDREFTDDSIVKGIAEKLDSAYSEPSNRLDSLYLNSRDEESCEELSGELSGELEEDDEEDQLSVLEDDQRSFMTADDAKLETNRRRFTDSRPFDPTSSPLIRSPLMPNRKFSDSDIQHDKRNRKVTIGGSSDSLDQFVHYDAELWANYTKFVDAIRGANLAKFEAISTSKNGRFAWVLPVKVDHKTSDWNVTLKLPHKSVDKQDQVLALLLQTSQERQQPVESWNNQVSMNVDLREMLSKYVATAIDDRTR